MFLPSNPHHITNMKFNNEREREMRDRERDLVDSVFLENLSNYSKLILYMLQLNSISTIL